MGIVQAFLMSGGWLQKQNTKKKGGALWRTVKKLSIPGQMVMGLGICCMTSSKGLVSGCWGLVKLRWSIWCKGGGDYEKSDGCYWSNGYGGGWCRGFCRGLVAGIRSEVRVVN